MHRWALSLLCLCLFCAFSGAQNPPSEDSDAMATPDPTALTATGIAPGDLVITINGFCDRDLLLVGTATGHPSQSSKDAQPADCKTEITRAQFEQMISALEPTMKRSNRIRVAVQYPENLIYAEKAQELNLDKDPQFRERLKLNYLQLLAHTYNAYLAQKAKDIPNAEVDKYYKEHPEVFERVNLQRIFVPREKAHTDQPASPAKLDQRRAEDEAEMKTVAESIHQKAAAGGDFEKLQAEASTAAGEDPEDTDVDLGLTTRDEIPIEYRQVFDLKAGEVSGPISAPKGWYICKVLSRETMPLAEAKGLLVRLRLQESTAAAKNSIQTKFNDNYFNTPHGMEAAKSSSVPK